MTRPQPSWGLARGTCKQPICIKSDTQLAKNFLSQLGVVHILTLFLILFLFLETFLLITIVFNFLFSIYYKIISFLQDGYLIIGAVTSHCTVCFGCSVERAGAAQSVFSSEPGARRRRVRGWVDMTPLMLLLSKHISTAHFLIRSPVLWFLVISLLKSTSHMFVYESRAYSCLRRKLSLFELR